MPRKLLFSLILAALVLTACAAPNPAPASNRFKVVATFSVLGDLVQNVGGDKVDVYVLVGSGLDTHTFEPSPTDSRALADAALVIENGLGFETWLDDLYAASGSGARRTALSQGIEPRTAGEEHDEPGAEAEHNEYDPHIWHSAANVIQMTKNIRDALITADPVNKAAYEANADAYLKQLQELDDWIMTEVATLPDSRRQLVTTHDTFGYFADRYGFQVIGTVLPTTTEGASPSAQEIAALVEGVKAAGVPAVFAENVSSNALLRQIADEAGVTVVASLYTDSLGPAASDGDTYLSMMRSNVNTIVTELSK